MCRTESDTCSGEKSDAIPWIASQASRSTPRYAEAELGVHSIMDRANLSENITSIHHAIIDRIVNRRTGYHLAKSFLGMFAESGWEPQYALDA